MITRWQWIVHRLLRRIWVRAAAFSIFGVLLALLAALVAPIVPYDLGAKIGSDAVDNILTILASSMLAVTTFSLTAMVSAFSGASSTITPRATQLLVQDPTAQNALSTFLGAFLFSIVGICALSTGIYGKSGRVILFIGTILVITIIVFTLLRWIEHLSNFGRVGNTIDRVERVTHSAIEKTVFTLNLHSNDHDDDPDRGSTIFPKKTGYVTHVDVKALEELADQKSKWIAVAVAPGSFVTPRRALAKYECEDLDDHEAICAAFTIARYREFDHDPRFGLVVLSEIASRALSPAVNDPGTAIAVLGAGVRVMTDFLSKREEGGSTRKGLVQLPDMIVSDLLDDLIQPIARDGAQMVEVAIRLQRSLGEIAAMAPDTYGLMARYAAEALLRSTEMMSFAPDLARVRQTHQEIWHGA